MGLLGSKPMENAGYSFRRAIIISNSKTPAEKV